ncbi:MAG: BREX-2 system adenine-specific DNA-methyltransferase PglX [Candidatus Eremiobacteraeota bacterium]|nr:BREX-2 system adenine-specific DNA-methyltransferase PglX [Candidatus Eremiobacteraeota bacterium]
MTRTMPTPQPAKTQSDLIRLVRALQEDLRQRCEEYADVAAPLRAEYSAALAAQSTQETYQAWSSNYLNQVAVAWVLAGVFVRYLEDNDLIEERWLAGTDNRRGEPRERYTAFFRKHPELSDREYFHDIFDQVAELPGCHDLFARDRNPLWKVGISGDGAKVLREFFAEVDANTGGLLRTFEGDTRFLGDLYQNLSEEAQKKYALLQTPEFVEEFILDRTLEPALAEFGLENVKLVDPTCGSGHFLLGAFHRLFRRWENAGYSGQNACSISNARALARRALEAVHGVDINPFAVAIARFRLVIAFVKACGLSRLREMPDVKVRVATGDSLLHGNAICSAKGWGVQELSDWLPDAFAAGDFEDASQILTQRYEAVVGNPPYITARDKAHNNEVRSRYRTAYMKYSLAVPFKEKFWDLAVEGKGQQRAGFVGMITANSFMKREFGSRVIEEFFPRVDLTHVIDTSGAYIPGHGTPTIILLGRNRAPVSDKVRAVLGIRGEPSTPADPAQGLVWRSILELLERPGESSAFVSVTEFDRATFAKHPWSIGGGGASELKEKIESAAQGCLGTLCDSIGFASFTGQDDVFAAPFGVLGRHGIPKQHIQGLVEGDTVRDFVIQPFEQVLVPYDSSLELSSLQTVPLIASYLWTYRNSLANIKTFGNKTKAEIGEPWWGWYRWVASKYKTALSIVFAFVATHNHFVLDRGGKVFNRTAPVIKLPNGASEEEHLALLGLLNSAAVCFWLKQICHNKGSTVDKAGARQTTIEFENFWEISGTQLLECPIPRLHHQTLPLASQVDRLASEHSALDPGNIMRKSPPGQWNLPKKQAQQDQIRQQMIALQEELDWLSYQLYSILDPAPLSADPPPLQLGERAFEIALARSGEETTWFSRHGSTPIKELPAHWPADYRATVEKRLDLIANNPEIALLEKPEHKRRWQQRPWEERLKEALTTWLQDRIEVAVQKSDHLQSVQQLADQLAHDSDFQQALQIHLGTNDYEAGESIYKLVQPQAVPYLAALRYSESGLRIRVDWEHTWDLQRLEDAGETVANIPVPPKYGQKDFLRSEYWSLRGKLDVPKERFISYLGAEREADASLVIGWAGWNHLQRAQALASYALERRELDGWEKDRLIPLLAGLAELLPWLKQWHNQVDPDTGERMADYFEAFLQEQLRELSATPSELATWRPVARMARSKK